MFLTEDQLHELLAIVDKHHNAFIANYVSPSALPAETVAKLQEAGIVDPQAQGIRDAFLFGMVAANLPGGGGPTVSYAQLADRLHRNPFPLSVAEQHAISTAQMTAGQYISGLGARVKIQAGQRVMRSDPQTIERDTKAYRKVISEAIAERKQLGSVASDLFHQVGDQARDLERVAATEMSNAMQHGTAAAAKKTFGDDVRVAKVARPACCDRCGELYNEPDGRPKIFKLSELESNGTNVGRKTKEWLPVIGATHPAGLCQLITINSGLAFNKDRMLVAEGG